MRLTTLLISALIGAAGFISNAQAHTADEPVMRNKNEPWMKRHLGFVEIAKTQTDCQVMFIGDSITYHWATKARDLWEANYAPLNAVNFGASGDRTQHLLWRLQNGEIGNLKPKVVVMLIGTNNIGLESDKKRVRNTPPQIVDGIKANLDYLRKALPESKVLLLGIFPRGEKGSPERKDVETVNKRIAKFHDGKSIFFLDLAPKFLGRGGELSKAIMGNDLLHPTPKGYEIWAAEMKEPLEKLLK